VKERLIDRERAVVANDQSPVIAQPADGAFDDPTPSVSPKGTTVLGGRSGPVLMVRGDQFDAPPGQSLSQRVAVVAAVGNHPLRFLPGTTRMVPSRYLDRLERPLRQPDFRRGCRVKVVSQRNTRAVDHHHPLRAFPPAGFAHCEAPFLAGAKLPSRKDSLHFNCCRSFNSLRKARQMASQIPCSSQSRSRRQQVEGCGNSSGRSCQRAPLRKIHKMPSSTLRSGLGGRPPRGRSGRLGSKGRIFSHWASVSNRPYRAIGPPSGAVDVRDRPPRENNYSKFGPLYRVLQRVLDADPIVRMSALQVLGAMLVPPSGNKIREWRSKIKQAFLRGVEDQNAIVRSEGIFGLAKLGDEDVIPIIQRLAEHDPFFLPGQAAGGKDLYTVRLDARRALAELKAKSKNHK
jgi:hypothetical protein